MDVYHLCRVFDPWDVSKPKQPKHFMVTFPFFCWRGSQWSHLSLPQHSHISHLLQILLSNIGGTNETWSSYPMGIFHFSRNCLAIKSKQLEEELDRGPVFCMFTNHDIFNHCRPCVYKDRRHLGIDSQTAKRVATSQTPWTCFLQSFFLANQTTISVQRSCDKKSLQRLKDS